jgi:hypothetical protein
MWKRITSATRELVRAVGTAVAPANQLLSHACKRLFRTRTSAATTTAVAAGLGMAQTTSPAWLDALKRVCPAPVKAALESIQNLKGIRFLGSFMGRVAVNSARAASPAAALMSFRRDTSAALAAYAGVQTASSHVRVDTEAMTPEQAMCEVRRRCATTVEEVRQHVLSLAPSACALMRACLHALAVHARY